MCFIYFNQKSNIIEMKNNKLLRNVTNANKLAPTFPKSSAISSQNVTTKPPSSLVIWFNDDPIFSFVSSDLPFSEIKFIASIKAKKQQLNEFSFI